MELLCRVWCITFLFVFVALLCVSVSAHGPGEAKFRSHSPLTDLPPSWSYQNPKCTENVTIYSYHIHVLFWQRNAQSVQGALDLRQRFMEEFHLKDGDPCNDANTTHGQSPPLCMFAIDYPEPATPFLTCDWAAFIPLGDFLRTVTWIMLHRGTFDTYIHPNTGCEIYDHRDWPLVGGSVWPMDFTAFHYDCPGCNIDDCTQLTTSVLLKGTSDKCGLAAGAKPTDPFVLRDVNAFCSQSCQDWAASVIDLPVQCTNTCDIVDSSQRDLCERHMNSRPELQDWLDNICNCKA